MAHITLDTESRGTVDTANAAHARLGVWELVRQALTY